MIRDQAWSIGNSSPPITTVTCDLHRLAQDTYIYTSPQDEMRRKLSAFGAIRPRHWSQIVKYQWPGAEPQRLLRTPDH